MTEEKPALDWQPLQLADFGSGDDKVRPLSPALKKPGPPNTTVSNRQEHEQTQGFLKGYDDGLVAGRVEGFAAGESAGAAEGQQAARQLLSLAASLDKSLVGLDQEISQEILALSLEITRQILRQTVAVKAEVVLTVVREALNQLPHQHAAIYLSPEDAELVRKYSGDQIVHAGHRINEDPLLQRGDVVIEANGAQVDATLATRWRRVVESLGNNTLWIEDEKT